MTGIRSATLCCLLVVLSSCGTVHSFFISLNGIRVIPNQWAQRDHDLLVVQDFSQSETGITVPQPPWREWHDSFLRNGLGDFVPPISTQVNCLVLESSAETTGMKLPWEQHDSDTNTLHKSFLTSSHYETTTLMLNFALTRSSTTLNHHYDCIFDPGFLRHLLSGRQYESAWQALYHASQALTEHGIYVLVAEPTVQDRHFLHQTGLLLGLEWNFGLDGISNDDYSVSVARRFTTKPLASMGNLAKVMQFVDTV